MQSVLVGNWQVTQALNQIKHQSTGEIVKLEPKVMQTLCLLIENANSVVTRADFQDQIWPNQVVVKEALSRLISELRKALKDESYIKTVPKQGYILVISPQFALTNSTNVTHENRVSVFNRPSYLVAIVCILLFVGFSTHYVYQEVNNRPTETNPSTQNTDLLVKQLASSLEDQTTISWVTNNPLQKIYRITRALTENENSQRALSMTLQDANGQELWSFIAPANTIEQVDTAANEFAQGVALIASSSSMPELNGIEPELHATYKRAWHFLDQRTESSLMQAIQLFNSVLAQHPEHVESLMAKASAFIGLNRYDGVPRKDSTNVRMGELIQQQARRIAPQHPRVLATDIGFAPGDKNWSQHEAQLLTLIKQDPTCRECIMSLVRFYWVVGWVSKSEKLLEDQLSYFPLSVQLHANLGMAYSRSGNIEGMDKQHALINLFGAQDSFDAFTTSANSAFAKGDTETWLAIHEDSFEEGTFLHTVALPFIQALANDDLNAMVNAANDFPPHAFFNFRLSIGQVDHLVTRVISNADKNNYFDLAQVHGSNLSRNGLTKYYVDNLKQLQNDPRIESLFKTHGLNMLWQQQNQWPDYCYRNSPAHYCK